MHYPGGVSDVTDPRGDLVWATLPGLVQDAAARFGGAEAVVDRHGPGGTTTRWSFDRLAAEGHPVTGWWPRWSGDLHAGRTETSLMLAIAPHKVRLELATAGDLRPATELLPLLEVGGVRSVSPTGVLGDPGGAGADEGERLLRAAADDLAAVVTALHRHQARIEVNP